jgi:hypothetical protein
MNLILVGAQVLGEKSTQAARNALADIQVSASALYTGLVSLVSGMTCFSSGIAEPADIQVFAAAYCLVYRFS